MMDLQTFTNFLNQAVTDAATANQDQSVIAAATAKQAADEAANAAAVASAQAAAAPAVQTANASAAAAESALAQLLSIPTAVVILIFFLLSSVSRAEVVPIDVDLQTQNCNQNYCQRSTIRATGSGVAIGRTYDDKFSIVITAGHVLEGTIAKIWVDGKEAQHYATKLDSSDDIGIILVDAKFKYTPLTAFVEQGEQLTLCGYLQNTMQLEKRPGTAVSDGEATMPAEQGLSGGPLLNSNGQVAGICSGYVVTKTRKRQTIFTPGSRIQSFMKSRSVYIQQQTAPKPPAEKLPPAPPASNAPRSTTTKPESPPSPAPTLGPQQDVTAIASRLASIEAKISAIPAGPPGPPGTAGPTGLEGMMGPRGNPGVITIILQDASGNVIKKVDNVASGSTVELPVTKSLKAPAPPTS